MMYFVYFIRIIFTKRHQQLNYANCRIFQNKLVVNREGREERNSPETFEIVASGRTMMWPAGANSGKFEALHSFLSFDKDFQIKQMLNFTFLTSLKYQSRL